MIKHNLLKLLVHLLLFSKNNITFSLNRSVLKFRILKDIGNDVNSFRNVLPKALGIIHSLFTRRVRVQVCTQILDLKLECVLRTPVGAFKSHVLEEMSDTVCFLRFCSTASIDPNADRSRLGVWL